MNVPPKIGESPAREVPIEVLPPAREPNPFGRRTDSGAGAGAASGPDAFPIHALSALTLVAVDSLWALFEFAPPLWIVLIPTCFLAVLIPVFLIQKTLKGDSFGRALAFATVLGVLAAVPTPVTGTPVGLALLGWTGLGRLLAKLRHA